MLRHHILLFKMSQANKINETPSTLPALPRQSLGTTTFSIPVGPGLALGTTGIPTPSRCPFQHRRVFLFGGFPNVPRLLTTSSYLLNEVRQAALAQPSPDPCPGSIPCKTNRSVSAEVSGVIKAIQRRRLRVTHHWTLPNLLGP